MRFDLLCPVCGVREFAFTEFRALILLAPNLALAHYDCDRCGRSLSVTLRLSASMRRELEQHSSQQPAHQAPTADPQDAAAGTGKPELPQDGQYGPKQISYASYMFVDEYDDGRPIPIPPIRPASNIKTKLEYFKRQLEQNQTVDQAIDDIDSTSPGENRES
ncbi:MAG: hypothetical protein LBR39_07220 [Coriobacteriales bacterium]|nr:hypothetical protein [Coriobacteriales bacterium]